MNADDKIIEAEFFLQKIIENYNEFPFVEYYFHAFVTSTRSIADYLLEDYNVKYDLKIPDDERNFRKKFKEKAYTLGDAKCPQCGFLDERALEFDKWYDRQITKITSDNIGSELWNKRNFIIHRGGGQIEDFSQKIARDMGIDIPKGVAIQIQSHDGEPNRSLPTTTIYLESMAYVDLKEVCEKFLSLMKEMVLEAHRQFL